MGEKKKTLSKTAIISYGFGGAATTLMMAFKNRFAMSFMTDVAGVSAAAIGTWMMLITIFDAINDPIIGGMADRTNTKMGKYRPWMFFGAIGLAIVIIMQFTDPGFGPSGNLYYFIFVMAMFSIAFTSVQVPWQALNSVMAEDPNDRNTLLASRQFIGLIASNAIGIFTIPVVTYFGGGALGWKMIAIIFGIIAMLSMWFASWGAKFKDYKGSIPNPQRMSLVSNIGLILNNKAAVLGGLSIAGFQLCRATLSAADMYYYKYVAQDTTIIAAAATFTLIANFVCVPFMPKLCSKLGKRLCAAVGLLLHMFRPILTMIFGMEMSRNLIIFCVIMTFIGQMIANFALLAMIPDCTDYTEYTKGTHCAALINSAVTFLQKFGGSFSTFIVGLVLSGAGYAADAEITDTVLNAILNCVTTVPMIITAVTLLFVFFFPINEAFGKKMRAELAVRRAAEKNA